MRTLLKRSLGISFLLLLLACLSGYGQTSPQDPISKYPQLNQIEPFQAGERILILSPHPDDETIGCAGIIQHALKKGANIHIVYLTNGDHNQFAFIVYEKRITLRSGEFVHMGVMRKNEAINAMGHLGLPETKLIFLGYPDFGTFTIFKDFWQKPAPYKSLLTRLSQVPYKDDFSYGMPYKPESILWDLKKILLKYRPQKIFVSHPADVNLDHKAFYLFLEIALADLGAYLPRPKIYPYLIHWSAWPIPRHYHPQLSLLPPGQLQKTDIPWVSYELKAQEINKKYRAILLYPTQTRVSAFYLTAFARKNELFGNYPEIELNIPLPEESKKNYSPHRLLNFFDSLRKFYKKDETQKTGLVFTPDDKIKYALEDNDLLIEVKKSKHIKSRLNGIFHCFGYSYRIPFAQMPKISIVMKRDKVKIFDGKKMISASAVKVDLADEKFTLRVPLGVLGEPDFVLIGIKAYTDNLPFYIQGFRKININRR